MGDRELEEALEKAFRHDFSEGTEAFRDELLARCLDVLGSDELDDGDLELLAAAGDPFGDNGGASKGQGI